MCIKTCFRPYDLNLTIVIANKHSLWVSRLFVSMLFFVGHFKGCGCPDFCISDQNESDELESFFNEKGMGVQAFSNPLSRLSSVWPLAGSAISPHLDYWLLYNRFTPVDSGPFIRIGLPNFKGTF